MYFFSLRASVPTLPFWPGDSRFWGVPPVLPFDFQISRFHKILSWSLKMSGFMTSNRITKYTNLICFKHLGTLHWKIQHWYDKRLESTWKRKSMMTIGGNRKFWKNWNGNRKSYPLGTPLIMHARILHFLQLTFIIPYHEACKYSYSSPISLNMSWWKNLYVILKNFLSFFIMCSSMLNKI